MKCKSCKEDVPPKFVHAISVNVCPLCGHEIMDSKLQSILNDLKSAMDKTFEYPEEAADWLFSNYGLRKGLSPVEKEAYFQGSSNVELPPGGHMKSQPMPNAKPPMMVRRAEDEMEVDSQPEEVSVFAQRAGLKASNFKKVIAGIQGAGAADPSEFQGVDDEYGDIGSEEPSAPLDSRGKKEIMSIFREDDAKTLELEKLKRLRSQASVAGNGGKFWRS